MLFPLNRIIAVFQLLVVQDFFSKRNANYKLQFTVLESTLLA